MNRLAERVALVTGGASGLGLATARKLADEGARLVLWDVDEARGQEVLAGMDAERTVFRRVDVAAEAEVDAGVAAALDRFGRIDVLINNAGITRDATLLKMTDEQFEQVVDVNLKGVFHCGRAVARTMVEAGSGAIVNISSVVALYGNFGQTNYVATKAGVIGMTRVWARELGRKGVRVNAVAPGFIATDMVRAMPEKVQQMMAERAPMQRMGRPEEIADACCFLASDEASFVNGAVLSVDGGLIS